MSWIPGFRSKKRKSAEYKSRFPEVPKLEQLLAISGPRTPSHKKWQPPGANLPTIDEIPQTAILGLQTPPTKRQRRGPQPSSFTIHERTAPSPFQWTPRAQRVQDILDLAENEWVDPDDDPRMDEVRSQMGEPPTPKQLKRKKFAEWRNRINDGDKRSATEGPKHETLGEFLEHEALQETYEDFMELEGRIRKKPKYAY